MVKEKNQNIRFVSDYRKEFAKLLNKFGAYGYSRFNVFRDFCTLAAISISNNSDPYHIATAEKTYIEREETYKRIIGKYKPEAQELFPSMFAEIVEEMQSYCPAEYKDVLGEIFHELEFSDSWTGQFFTSQDVCNFMGIVSFNDKNLKEKIDRKGYVTVNDSACGGGATLLGVANAMYKLGLNPQKQMLIVCNDIDERCVYMCYVQLSLYGLPAIVYRQNTLTQEYFDEPWFTPIFTLDGWTIKSRRAFRDEPITKPSIKTVTEMQQTSHVEQLTLF